MKRCKNCDALIREDDRYCRNCGILIFSNFYELLYGVFSFLIIIGIIIFILVFIASYILE